MTKCQAYTKSATIAIVYVGLATFTIFNSYGSSPYYGEWVLVALVLTFPVSIISFGITYADKEAYLLIVSVQFVMFLITGWLIYIAFYRKKIR